MCPRTRAAQSHKWLRPPPINEGWTELGIVGWAWAGGAGAQEQSLTCGAMVCANAAGLRALLQAMLPNILGSCIRLVAAAAGHLNRRRITHSRPRAGLRPVV